MEICMPCMQTHYVGYSCHSKSKGKLSMVNSGRFGLLLALIALMAACATTTHQTPKAWAQKADEASTLPVGVVLAVEPEKYATGNRTDPAGSAAAISSVGPIAIPIFAMIDSSLATGTAYRHAIRIKGTGEVIYRTELAPYTVGDCVAIRNQPALVVPAIAGACN